MGNRGKRKSNTIEKDPLKEGGKSKKETQEKREEEGRKKDPLITFSSFIMSLAASALVNLGGAPGKEKERVDLTAARQIIDIIDMLKKKTEGNRTEEETRLIEEVLYELRMAYLAKSKFIKL